MLLVSKFSQSNLKFQPQHLRVQEDLDGKTTKCEEWACYWFVLLVRFIFKKLEKKVYYIFSEPCLVNIDITLVK
jgi:hypothetical protein